MSIDGLLRSILKSAARLSVLFACLAGADQDEAWLGRAPLPAATNPLLIFVLDTSAAMSGRIRVAVPYDPQNQYRPAAGAAQQCDPERVYWRRGPGPAPDCRKIAGLSSQATIAEGAMLCESARAPLARHGYFVASRAAQWRPAGAHWDALSSASAEAVECRDDRGRHGAAAGPWFAANGRAGPWNQVPESEIDWNAAPHGEPYMFYSGNFLNYLAAAALTSETSLAAAASAAISAAVDAENALDVAVIRLSDRRPDAEGGFVLLAPVSAAVAASRLPSLFAGISPTGGAPLAETMTEVAAWLSGDPVRYGEDARADAAARDPQDPARYRSPFSSPCRPVTIAVVTAGEASEDAGAGFFASGRSGFTELTGGCDANCLPALAQWLAQSDLRPDLPGRQHAHLAWVNPFPRPSLVAASLERAAGKAEFLEDPLALANIIARGLQHDAAVAGGAQLSAAGMLPTQQSAHEPAVIYGLSVPQARQRWLGNLLRYGLRAPVSPFAPPVAIGRDGEPALDPESGLPRKDSFSEWSDQADGDALLSGGAAARLPPAGLRRLYSNVTDSALTSDANRLTPGNRAFSRAALGLGPHDTEHADQLISWLLDQRRLGDPGLRAPASLSYEGVDSRTTFVATHDGLLHAFDADTGVERWAFIPRPMLSRLAALMRDESSIIRSHGIDGPLVLHRHDPDGDGRVDAGSGEHLWLIFGLGRGGSGYYALDVASPDEPRLLWSLTPADTGDHAESWAEPVITRLSVAGTSQGPGSWVVVLAGGYDRGYDFPDSPAAASGASLTIVDAATGVQLWRAAGRAAWLPDLHLPDMSASLASAPRVLDLNGDGYADRMYSIDLAGGLWRIDLQNEGTPANLARARLVARLGGGERRFYSSPDVAMIRAGGAVEVAISFGSGWIARPRDNRVVDRFYSIRDPEPGHGLLQESDLHDATQGQEAMAVGAPGWFVRLDAHGAGEKVIGSSLTFDHRLHFLSYQPAVAPASAVCGPPQAVRRLYRLDVRTGLPASRVNPGRDRDERELPASGLPSALRFAFPGSWDQACPDCRARPVGLAGSEIFDAEFANDPVRTSWRKLPVEPDSH